MKRQNKRELTDSVLIQAYFDNNARVNEAFKSLRQQGYTFGNTGMRERLRKAIADHNDCVVNSDAGSVDPITSTKMGDGNYFITSAQNNTKVHEGFFDTLLNFCDRSNAKLLVSKFTYKRKGFENLTSELVDNHWYDHKLLPYLINSQIQLGDFIFYGNFDILPTAVNPLSGLESHSSELDCAFPHVKLQMRSVATMPNIPAKHIYTTGACTLLNYVPRKAGQKAELHHVFGGLFIKVRNGKAEITPVVADSDTGHFNIYREKWEQNSCKEENVFSVNFGDIHLEKLTDDYFNSICTVLDDLKPQHVFLHDVLDFEARNHHEVYNKFARFKKYVDDRDSVERNVVGLLDWLNGIAKRYPKTTFHVVPSNHNDAFYKWANVEQPSNDYPNLKFWHFVNYTMLDALCKGEEQELLPIIADALNMKMRKNIKFHERSESVRYFEIEFNMHGDVGANGSRGSPQGLSKLGFKANTGHTHSAGIYNSVYVAGVSGTLDHGYNKGLSSWSNSFIITYYTGKRTIITQYP